MSLPRALLISTVVVICVVEAVAHVPCCSSPAKTSLNPAGLPGSRTSLTPPAFPAPGSSNHLSLLPSFSNALEGNPSAQNPAARRWEALLADIVQEAVRETLKESLLKDSLLKEAANTATSTAFAHKPGWTKKQAIEAVNIKWVSPHYETWNPPQVYGPPLPPERIRVQQQAHRLLQDLSAGRLCVLYDARDGDQLRCLERDGIYGWPDPLAGVSIRSPRQRAVLEGTAEEAPSKESYASDDKRLASRSGLPQRFPTANPADDPEFDPCNLPPAPGLLRLLTTLAAHSTATRPLTLLSLLRPPYRFGDYVHVGPNNPHSLGLAVDIAAYGGHSFRQSEPEECIAAAISLLHDLPPGRYRLGMPKAPENVIALPTYLTTHLGTAALKPDLSALSSDAPDSSFFNSSTNSNDSDVSKEVREAPNGRKGIKKGVQNESTSIETNGCLVAALYGLHAGNACLLWPFFPAPFMETISVDGTGSGADSETESMPASASTKAPPRPGVKRVMRFQNESYAAEADLNDVRLREALAAARKRGADVIALFPDGLDHLHVDVRQNP